MPVPAPFGSAALSSGGAQASAARHGGAQRRRGWRSCEGAAGAERQMSVASAAAFLDPSISSAPALISARVLPRAAAGPPPAMPQRGGMASATAPPFLTYRPPSLLRVEAAACQVSSRSLPLTRKKSVSVIDGVSVNLWLFTHQKLSTSYNL